MQTPTTHDAREIQAAITAHRQAYEAYTASRARLWAMHELFDPEHEMQDPEAVKAALAAPQAAGWPDPATYLAEEARCQSLATAEDEAWLRVRAIKLVTRKELEAWHAYVIEHSVREDEAVNLRSALAHVSNLLTAHLA